MRQNALIRSVLSPLKRTPLHPQWFVFKDEVKDLREVGALAKGVVLDIGSGEQKVQAFLPVGTNYISLDYYQTAREWYGTRPRIFADGQRLPIRNNSVDTVFLLDVLEHLPRPDDCMAEIRRVLRPGGTLLLQVPFLYPLHDAPYDFYRWTIYGLRSEAAKYGFIKQEEILRGHPLETAALLTNLALSRIILDWYKRKNVLFLLAPLLMILLPFCNGGAWILSKMSLNEGFMPRSYRMVWKKLN